MHLFRSVVASALLLSQACAAFVPANDTTTNGTTSDFKKLTPKFFIISMFSPEAEIWYGIPEFNLLAQNITLPGLSPLFPAVHCTASGDICQVVTGEAEINAASTITALVVSPHFDLTKTYFMIGGIGGVNPNRATINDVTFARYAVQVALSYEIDAREIPSNFSTGYFPFGAYAPATSAADYPQTIYGTEVFELNTALRSKAVEFARKAKLNDTAAAIAYRAHYTQKAARMAPSVRECDVATSDVYYSGNLLGETFDNVTRVYTNGTGRYCNTAEEDNGTLEAMVRAASVGLVDFARIMLMRTCSDFDRPYAGESTLQNLLYSDQGAFESAVMNIYLAGREVIAGVVGGWEAEFEKGIAPKNYIGDIFNTLGGAPNFGLPSMFIQASKAEAKKRAPRTRGEMKKMGRRS